MVRVSCELVRPYPDKPTEGFIQFQTNLSQMANPSFEMSRQTPLAVELGRVIERGLKQSRAVDTESLCVSAGEQVWSIRVDMHALNDDGNLIDALALGSIAALKHFRRLFES